MKTQVEIQWNRESVSALMDGQLQDAEVSSVLQDMAASEARECWHVYHVIGDVLRSSELAHCAHDADFVARLSQRLQAEAPPRLVPMPSQPPVLPDVAMPAANDGVFRWKMVAGLASFAAVAAIGWGVMGGIGPQPGGAQLAQGAAGSPTQIVTLAAPIPMEPVASQPEGAVMLRDPRLDELLAEHRQAVGASALANAAGFLRNATFEGSGR